MRSVSLTASATSTGSSGYIDRTEYIDKLERLSSRYHFFLRPRHLLDSNVSSDDSKLRVGDAAANRRIVEEVLQDGHITVQFSFERP